MSDAIIYHNGECSKCKGALELLIERGIPHNVRWYLADPLSREELQSLLRKLNLRPQDLLRTSEPLYAELFQDNKLSDDEALDVLVNHPSLMQRPVLEKGDKAIIARPPERIFEIL